MKFYQIKSTAKGDGPARWYRLLVPSGITFSQLYVLLAYVHGELYFMSRYFTFETRDRSLCIEEPDEDMPDFGQPLYDKYDSAGTYIDTIFTEGFRISLYTGSDFDLRIDVEKDAVEREDLPAPQVIKVSRAIADEEGGQPIEEILPEALFGIEVADEHEFACAEELAERIQSGWGTVMKVSADPVTPEESITRGKMSQNLNYMEEIMEPLRMDRDIGPLMIELDAPETGERAHNLILARIGNLMIEKHGEPLTEYIANRMLENTSPELAEMLASVKQNKYRQHGAQALAGAYAKEDLLKIAEDYGVAIPPRAITRTIAKKLATALFNVDSILSRMQQLDDSEMDLLRRAVSHDEGWYPETEKEEEAGEELKYMILAFELSDGRIFAPDEVRHTYAANWNDELETGRKKRNWMKACLEIARSFYGVMSWAVLGKMFARRFKNTDQAELRQIFEDLPEYTHDFTEYDGRLMLKGYEEDEYYKFLENAIQKDKPFYIPSRREIEEFYDKGCLLSSQSHQAMYRFLVNSLGVRSDLAELQVAVFYDMVNNEVHMQEVVDSMEELLGEEHAFRSEEDFRKFTELYMNMNNFSHLQANRGYTPNDMFHSAGGARGLPKNLMISPGGPEAAEMLNQAREELTEMVISLDEERMQDVLPNGKRRKIGRNESCPCGSGKKYKNCCGKK